MLRNLFSLAAGFLLAGSLLAIPAKRITTKVIQADGTTLSVQLTGDEAFHYFRTLDGVPVVKRADGTFCYAQLADGRLVATDRVAHEAAARTADEILFVSEHGAKADDLRGIAAERMRLRNDRRTQRLSRRKTAANRVGEMGNATVGKRKGLVILVNFKDKKMNAAHTRQVFDDMMNKEGYTGNGNTGSVHDYFYQQSYGKFDLTFDVVGPVTVSKNLSYYGSNDSYGNDKYAEQMVAEACRLADADPSVNWADYDWDNDGEVDQVYVIYAGYNEAQGGPSNTIWPHEFELSYSNQSLTLGGKLINTYGCSSELRGNSGNEMDGIGTACHEFSHCLGLPDLYDTSTMGDAFGMSEWSLMDYGSYNDDSHTPAAYTSYERMASGWLVPTELTAGHTVKGMKALVDSPEAYIIYNDKNRNEYYLLENRQLKGFDAALSGHGMLVLHVDYDASAWYKNIVNNDKSHQRCGIIPADNSLMNTTSDLAGDPYPGTANNNALTDVTKPAATLFNANSEGKKYMGKPLTEIFEEDGLISFKFMGGKQLSVPAALSVTDITPTSFTAHWQPVEDATSYLLEIREAGSALPSDNLLDEVDFSKWGTGLSSDKNADISDRLSSYITTPGWSGTKVYEGPARAKLGSSSVAGKLASPAYTAPASGNVTVRFGEQPFGIDSKRLTVSLLNARGEAVQTENISLSGGTHIVNFGNVPEDFSVVFQPAKRCYLTQRLGIYDGTYSEGDFADETEAGGVKANARRAARLIIKTDKTVYTITELNENTTYLWRVKAENAEAFSPWSELQTVALTDGLSRTANNVPAPADKVAVYGVDGRKLLETRFGRWSDGLPAGTYLLKGAGGVTKAVKR